MLITYTPEGQEPQEFTFTPGQMKTSQAAILERSYSRLAGEKMSFMEFVQDLRTKAPDAVRVALHWCQKQAHPSIRLDDVDPRLDEVRIRFHRADFDSAAELVAKLPDAKMRADALAMLKVEIAAAVDAEPDVDPGKADGQNSSSAPDGSQTASRSPRRGSRTG